MLAPLTLEDQVARYSRRDKHLGPYGLTSYEREIECVVSQMVVPWAAKFRQSCIKRGKDNLYFPFLYGSLVYPFFSDEAHSWHRYT